VFVESEALFVVVLPLCARSRRRLGFVLAHEMRMSSVCGDRISFRRRNKQGAQSQTAPFPQSHRPQHPTGQAPKEPTEAHQTRRGFNRAVHPYIDRDDPELELILSQMAQKPMLRGEVGARALRVRSDVDRDDPNIQRALKTVGSEKGAADRLAPASGSQWLGCMTARGPIVAIW